MSAISTTTAAPSSSRSLPPTESKLSLFTSPPSAAPAGPPLLYRVVKRDEPFFGCYNFGRAGKQPDLVVRHRRGRSAQRIVERPGTGSDVHGISLYSDLTALRRVLGGRSCTFHEVNATVFTHHSSLLVQLDLDEVDHYLFGPAVTMPQVDFDRLLLTLSSHFRELPADSADNLGDGFVPDPTLKYMNEAGLMSRALRYALQLQLQLDDALVDVELCMVLSYHAHWYRHKFSHYEDTCCSACLRTRQRLVMTCHEFMEVMDANDEDPNAIILLGCAAEHYTLWPMRELLHQHPTLFNGSAVITLDELSDAYSTYVDKSALTGAETVISFRDLVQMQQFAREGRHFESLEDFIRALAPRVDETDVEDEEADEVEASGGGQR